jgi:predicted Zn-dependent protease
MYRKIVLFFLGLLLAVNCMAFNLGSIDLKGVYDAATKVKDLGNKDAAEERKIGQDVTGILLAKSAVSSDRALQRYVNRVGRWLSLNSERPELEWRFVVLSDGSFNAFATPGGYVFITTGALAKLDTEAELAGVLAHEIGHVVRKHYLQAIKTQAAVDVAVDVGSVVYGAYSNSQGDNSFASQMGLGAKEQMRTAVDDLYTKGLDRRDEYEADKMAMVLAARAGYDPYAYITVLQKIDSEHVDNAAWQVFLQRHPPADERIESLEPMLERSFVQQDDYRQLGQRYAVELKR